jgi:hypothetical protein
MEWKSVHAKCHSLKYSHETNTLYLHGGGSFVGVLQAVVADRLPSYGTISLGELRMMHTHTHTHTHILLSYSDNHTVRGLRIVPYGTGKYNVMAYTVDTLENDSPVWYDVL